MTSSSSDGGPPGWLLAGGGIASLALVVVLLSSLGSTESAPDVTATVIERSSVPTGAEEFNLPAKVPENGIALGDPAAPVTLVEFADPQSPICAAFAKDALPDLVERYVATKEIRIELRLLNSLGRDSRRLANAANAAGEQDGLWTFTNLAFARQGAENSGYAELAFIRELAVDAGLKPEPILTAANFSEADIPTEEARKLAAAQGIDSTPSFLIGTTGDKLDLIKLNSFAPAAIEGRIESAIAAADQR